MPGLKNTTKKLSKKAEAAQRANMKTISGVLSGVTEDVIFARVEANLGAGGFRLILNNASQAIGIPRGLFNKNTMRIERNTIVLCSAAEHNAAAKIQSYEIIGVLSRKDAQTLWKEKKITRFVWLSPEEEVEEKDDYFDYGEQEDNSDVDVDAL